MYGKNNTETFITMCKIICCMAQETQTGAPCQTWRGGMGREMGGRFKREVIHVYLWLIHVAV